MKQIIIECNSCMHINKNYLGMPGFKLLKVRYESLTDAFNHLQNTQHEMNIIWDESEDEE